MANSGRFKQIIDGTTLVVEDTVTGVTKSGYLWEGADSSVVAHQLATQLITDQEAALNPPETDHFDVAGAPAAGDEENTGEDANESTEDGD